MKQNNLEKGITLIALVITIVVLLILAGVTLNLVLGENGIINKAQEAAKVTKIEEAKEKVKMALIDYEIAQSTGKEKSLQDCLEDANVTVSSVEDGNYTVTVDGYEFKINEDTLEIEGEGSKVEEITYTISFDANGGELETNEKTVIYNSTYGELPTPIKLGYRFIGWYTEASGGTQITNTTKVTITSNQTLYAMWGTLQFTGKGSQLYTLNNPGNLSSSAGYGPTLEIEIPSGGYTIEANVNVGSAGAGTVKFINSSGVTTTIAEYRGSEVNTTYDITEKGMLKLSTASGITLKLTTGELVPLEFNGYSVTLNSNGGIISFPAYAYNKILGKGDNYIIHNFTSSQILKSGYTLLGWSENQNATTATYVGGQTITPTKDMTLYAVWQAN